MVKADRDKSEQPAQTDERLARYVEAMFAIGWALGSSPSCMQMALAAIPVADAEQAELRAEVERLHGTVADYEQRIAWDTTCRNCATTYDLSVSQTFRAEAAERALAAERAKVARVEALHFDPGNGFCDHCWPGPRRGAPVSAEHYEWPCPTARALAGPEPGATEGGDDHG